MFNKNALAYRAAYIVCLRDNALNHNWMSFSNSAPKVLTHTFNGYGNLDFAKVPCSVNGF